MSASRPDARPHMRRPAPSPRYVIHQFRAPDEIGDTSCWCIVDRAGDAAVGGPGAARAPVREHAPFDPDHPTRWTVIATHRPDGDDTEQEAAMLASADNRQRFTDDQDPDGHHVFLAVTLAELGQMGLGHLVGRGRRKGETGGA